MVAASSTSVTVTVTLWLVEPSLSEASTVTS